MIQCQISPSLHTRSAVNLVMMLIHTCARGLGASPHPPPEKKNDKNGAIGAF